MRIAPPPGSNKCSIVDSMPPDKQPPTPPATNGLKLWTVSPMWTTPAPKDPSIMAPSTASAACHRRLSACHVPRTMINCS